MATATEIQAKIDELSGNMDKLDNIVNGGENATVTTDGGELVHEIGRAHV